MIQSMAAPHGDPVTYPTAGRSRRKTRRGIYGLVAIVLMAGAGALVGGVQARVSQETRDVSPDMLPPGPFSYFPR